MRQAVAHHWPEYLMDAGGLGLFMLAVCVFASVLEYPPSPVHQVITDPNLRRAVFGFAVGLTTTAMVYSPWGQQSGAHLNPSVTLTFFRLGKIDPWDHWFYVVAQFAGALVGILLGVAVLGSVLAHPTINYGATVPGTAGSGVAFVAETTISFGFMLVVLLCSNACRWARYTGLLSGALVALYIVIEAPLSGSSMNPAQTLASAVPSGLWSELWLYFTAPPLGMLLAAQTYVRLRGSRGVVCAKLNHHNDKRCIFRCGYAQRPPSRA